MEFGGDFAASSQGYGRPTYNDKRAAELPATQERSRRDWRKEGKRPAQQKATDAQAIPANESAHESVWKVIDTMNRKKEIAGVGLLGNTAKGDDESMKQMKTIGDVSKCAARHMPCPLLTLSNPHARRYIVAFNGQMVTNIDSHSIDFVKKILYDRTDTNKTELNI